jgi:transposase InsO family protein
VFPGPYDRFALSTPLITQEMQELADFTASRVLSLASGSGKGRHGPWRTTESVELATLGWVDWWNHRRLHGARDDTPPAQNEALYYAQHPALPVA